jgi:hypothetical protein
VESVDVLAWRKLMLLLCWQRRLVFPPGTLLALPVLGIGI